MIPSDDEHSPVTEFHIGKVIDIVIAFAFCILIDAGAVIEIEFLLFESKERQGFLFGIFTHQFQKDRSVTVEDFVCSCGRFLSYFFQFLMIGRFTINGTKDFIRTSKDRVFTPFTGSNSRRSFRDHKKIELYKKSDRALCTAV